MLAHELTTMGILMAGLALTRRGYVSPHSCGSFDLVARLTLENCMGTSQGKPLDMLYSTEKGW